MLVSPHTAILAKHYPALLSAGTPDVQDAVLSEMGAEFSHYPEADLATIFKFPEEQFTVISTLNPCCDPDTLVRVRARGNALAHFVYHISIMSHEEVADTLITLCHHFAGAQLAARRIHSAVLLKRGIVVRPCFPVDMGPEAQYMSETGTNHLYMFRSQAQSVPLFDPFKN